MSKRIVALVHRGMTDRTPVIVWQHEIGILEAIHGDGAATSVDLGALLDEAEAVVVRGTTRLVDLKNPEVKLIKGDKNAESVEMVGMFDGKPQKVTLPIERIHVRELVAKGLGLGDEFEGDPTAEHERMARLYGLHPNAGVPVVEYVYGRYNDPRWLSALGVKSRERQAA